MSQAASNLDDQRAAAATGAEVLLDSDATVAELATLRHLPEVVALAGDLARLGLGLRLLPASYALEPQDRRRLSAWLEEDIVHVGVLRGARTGAILRAGARVLKMAEGCYLDRGPSARRKVIGDAVLEATVFDYLQGLGFTQELQRSVRTFGARLSSRRLDGSLSSPAVVESAAAHAWSMLVVMDAAGREITLEHIRRIEPRVADLSTRMLAAAGAVRGAFNADRTVRALEGTLTFP